MADTDLLQTVLHSTHVRLGGRMVPFAGYDMPVQYSGILAEARAVRTAAGIFDVSHMGRFRLEGPDARALLDWVHTASIGESMPIGRARYGLFCNEQGGIIDDGIIYRLEDEQYLLIANAANAPKVLAWVTRWRDERYPGVTIEDITSQVAMIALQGPKAIEIMTAVSDFDPGAVRPFRIAEVQGQGKSALVARTGYTGEDGVEVMPASEDAPSLWQLFMEHGAVPCGLGSRDTLRLEAGLLLHGSDMDETINPIEAGMERFVSLDDGEFCGAGPIRDAAAKGPERLLTGFVMDERGAVPRGHADILIDGAVAGQVTSGGYSPSLDSNIGLGYVPSE
ncbi:MAG: glycine cleavage system aminomethyltransferase GcvT, partial [Dehalococcoidia bacterium]